MDDERRRDRQMIELLNELRIALPGVQILFGFLLIVPFSAGFDQASGFQRNIFAITVLLTGLSTACLIAPSAAHRIRFHQGDRPWLIESASRMLLAGLAFLALALILAVVLVMDFLFDDVRVWLFPAAVAAAFAVLWFALPMMRDR